MKSSIEKSRWSKWHVNFFKQGLVYVCGMLPAVEFYLECKGFMGQIGKWERKQYLGVKNWAGGGKK